MMVRPHRGAAKDGVAAIEEPLKESKFHYKWPNNGKTPPYGCNNNIILMDSEFKDILVLFPRLNCLHLLFACPLGKNS